MHAPFGATGEDVAASHDRVELTCRRQVCCADTYTKLNSQRFLVLGNTAQVAGYERAEQPWYICHECDAEWKNDMEMFRVCVACARNCHKGRLGHRTRFCKLSKTRCMCCERGEGSCLYFSKKVRAANLVHFCAL